MDGVRKSITINATPEQCYDIIWDFARYPDYQREMKAVTVHREAPDKSSAEVTFRAEVMKEVEYTLRFTGNRPRGFHWTQTKGFFKKNDGGWDFKDLGDGRTEATYSLDFAIGGLVPKAVINKLIEANFPNMLRTFKERIENLVG